MKKIKAGNGAYVKRVDFKQNKYNPVNKDFILIWSDKYKVYF